MDAFLTHLEHAAPGGATRTYAENVRFYVEYAVDLRALQTRAAALQRNSITVEQIELMERNLELLRALHQSQSALSVGAIRSAREQFNAGWTTILTFELAKKR